MTDSTVDTSAPVDATPVAPVPNPFAIELIALSAVGADFDSAVLEFARTNQFYGSNPVSMALKVLSELCGVSDPTFAEFKVVWNTLQAHAEFFAKTGMEIA